MVMERTKALLKEIKEAVKESKEKNVELQNELDQQQSNLVELINTDTSNMNAVQKVEIQKNIKKKEQEIKILRELIKENKDEYDAIVENYQQKLKNHANSGFRIDKNDFVQVYQDKVKTIEAERKQKLIDVFKEYKTANENYIADNYSMCEELADFVIVKDIIDDVSDYDVEGHLTHSELTSLYIGLNLTDEQRELFNYSTRD